MLLRQIGVSHVRLAGANVPEVDFDKPIRIPYGVSQLLRRADRNAVDRVNDVARLYPYAKRGAVRRNMGYIDLRPSHVAAVVTPRNFATGWTDTGGYKTCTGGYTGCTDGYSG